MCSELFRIPYELHGVPIFGFGLLVALWTIGCALVLFLSIRRRGWNKEILGLLPVMVLVGVAIVLLPKIFPGGLPIRGYGVMLLAGIVAGVGTAMVRAERGGLNPEVIVSLAVWLVVCGVVGARLFYVIEYWDEKFAGRGVRETLLEILNVPAGGLVIYGGFFGAAVAFVFFVRKHGLPLGAMADLAAPSLMIGLALGRVGCFLNGCCYGGPADLPWAVTFPENSPPYVDQLGSGELFGFRFEALEDGARIIHVERDSPAGRAGLAAGDVIRTVNGRSLASAAATEELLFRTAMESPSLALGLASGEVATLSTVALPARSRPVHPTQIYSAIDGALLAWVLWAYFPFRRRDGEVVALMLTLHPITRFLLEIIRTDEPAVFGTGLSISQNISLLLLVGAAVLWWHLSRRPQGVTWPLVPEGSTLSTTRSGRPDSGRKRRGEAAGSAQRASRSGARSGRS